jgi:lauroyl/myristoyl acyltransferase
MRDSARMGLEIGRLPRDMRRAAKLAATRGLLTASNRLSPQGAISLGRAIGQSAAGILPLRMRLSRNMALGLGRAPHDAVANFFRNLGRLCGWSMAIYHHGFWASGVQNQLEFDESVKHLDDAVARGRGVILASPHQFCHEIGAAYISGRHQVVAMVRETASPQREAMKEQWYRATGMEIVRRPRRTSLRSDVFACLRVLKRGSLLAMAPDVIVRPAAGAPVRVFGRDVYLSPGMVVLAMRAQAPLLTAYLHWSKRGRHVIRFTEALEYAATGDRERTAAEGLQVWCRQFEANVRAHPGNWMFWLDKHWTKALRGPRPSGGESRSDQPT